MTLEILFGKLKQLYNWAINLDYTQPRIFLSALALGILPFIATYFVLTGLVIAICLAISTLFMVEKMPPMMKSWIHKNPLVADLVLSTVGILGISAFVGGNAGLTLALGFIFLDVILAVTLPYATSLDLVKV